MEKINLNLEEPTSKEINPHIKFDCIVNNQRLTAAITHVINHILYPTYQVTFSDGHTGVFQTNEDSELWDELDVELSEYREESRYAKAISPDLDAIIGIEYKSEYPFCIKVRHDDEVFNVWVGPGLEKYSVRYQKDFRFYIDKQTLAPSTVERHNGYINQDIARIVKERILKLGL